GVKDYFKKLLQKVINKIKSFRKKQEA
uniref:Oxyopinin-3b n=4 Tax=Oxyopes takobius TaxID=666126 RepID=TOP3B_OXYTA|nr:RecName: Full=Oxyopinin-3b; Short=Oxt-3b [Oxyopes takobius]